MSVFDDLFQAFGGEEVGGDGALPSLNRIEGAVRRLGDPVPQRFPALGVAKPGGHGPGRRFMARTNTQLARTAIAALKRAGR